MRVMVSLYTDIARPMYAEHILDHYHNPRCHGTLAAPTHTADGHNTSCGDKITMALQITDGVIADAAFDGDGCAISQAAASLLLEHLVGKDVSTLENLDASGMLELVEIDLSPARIKCGLLALETAQRAYHNQEK